MDSVTECYLHGFGDASKGAYCAVVYLVYQLNDGSRHASLLTSKTRVAPLKQLTIPRLELMSATVLARLVDTVRKALEPQLKVSGTTYWLDSKTALCWIRNRGEWKQFVRHRVNSILELTRKENWRYCPGEWNPADIGSRGMLATALKNDSLWWKGPPWLEDSETEWPPTIDELEQTPESLTEVKKNTTVMVADVREECSIANVIDVNRYSSFTKLARVTAWVSRFVSNTRAQRNKQEKLTGQLEVSEVNRAEIQWIKVAQSELRTQGNFKQLVKELDLKEEAGIYRCRGRLVHSGLDVEAKTPIDLPKEHRVTNLLIERCHERVLHSGLRATLAEIRAKYWIPRGRQVVKKLLGRCVMCRRTAG